MKKTHVSTMLISLALCLLLAAALTFGVGARTAIDTDRLGSISLTYGYDGQAFEGLEIRLFRVANVDRSCIFALTDDFTDYPVEVNTVRTQDEWRQIASTLHAYAAADVIEPTAIGTTDSEGKIVFSDLATGLYLIEGVTTEYMGGYCTFDSFMLSVPTVYSDIDNDTWVYDLEAVPKSVTYQPGENTYTVNKIWKDAGVENKRPPTIKVELIRDGLLYEEVTLSAENNWSYSWTVIDDGAKWLVVERQIPEGYQVTIDQNDTTFIIANTHEDDDPPPQTGDTSSIYLYVILMCIAGAGLLAVGIGMNRGKKQ